MKRKTFQNEAWEILAEDRVDYLWFVTKSSTREQRLKFDIGDIFINGAVCLICHKFIRSMDRHDYRICRCGAVAVDGGSWYARRVGNQKNRVDVIENFYDVG